MNKLKEIESLRVDELSLLKMIENKKRIDLKLALLELALINQQINRLEKKGAK